MSLFFGGRQQRAISYQDVWSSGDPLTLQSAMTAAERMIPLFAAHRLIIDSVASTPLHGYLTGPDGVPQRMPQQPALLTSPPIGTAFTWKAQYAASQLADGNAFGLQTSWDAAGWPTSLYWLCPYDVQVDETGALPRYAYNGVDITDQVIHIPWIVPAGKFRGISPLKSFKVAIETGVAAQQTARDWFVGGAIPSGHLKRIGGGLSPEVADSTKAKFKNAVRGRDVFVSGDDWDYQTIGVPADEARFVEQLRLSASQIASIYGVPPEEIGGEVSGDSLTYSTLEMNETKFNRRVVQPWAIRLEEALTAVMPQPQYAKFNLDANVRSDLKSRMEAHQIGLEAGVLTQDEARRLEDRAPLTEQQRADWLEAWRSAAGARDMSVAEVIQKIYLGVGKVITVDEARDIVRQHGFDLSAATAADVFANLPPSPTIGGAP